jgi:protein gp37
MAQLYENILVLTTGATLKDVPDDFIFQVFDVMAQADWHTFQVLTKRPSRLARLVPRISERLRRYTSQHASWPEQIWLGVSIETIQYSWRAEQLRRVPASVRFISAEPLLASLKELDLTDIHWLIAGGESGPGHRPCDPEWLRELRDRCIESGTAFFFKQWGGRTPKTGGRLLDGRTWDDYPQLTPVSL